MTDKKVLILGGTGEAAALATRLSAELAETTEIITSLAGRTKTPTPLPGRVISGGFGGIQGIKLFVEDEGINVVIDATHPFAETISDSAYVACTVTNTLRMTLLRPEWNLPAEARWLEVDSMEAASEALGKTATRAFLTIGKRGLDAFAGLENVWFLVRLIEQPDEPLPFAECETITGRPPHDVDAERAVMEKHQINALVSKHAGGSATEGKILAALGLDIPIILIRRPPRLPGLCTESLDDCVDWVKTQI